MRRVAIWLVSVVSFLAIATIFERIDWSKLFGQVARRDAAVAEPSSDRVAASDAPTRDVSEISTSEGSSEYLPPDTPQLLYEYSMVGDTLSRLQSELTMIRRIDGLRTINGKRYYKEVTEFTGQEDLVELLRSPPTNTEEAGFLKSKEVAKFIESFKPSVSYSRWDQTSEWDLDGDDLTRPETRGAPLHIDVGTEWSEEGLRARAVSIEDVDLGDRAYKDCLKIRASGTVDGTNVQGVVMYAARGIGLVKITYTEDVTFVLRKYRR